MCTLHHLLRFARTVIYKKNTVTQKFNTLALILQPVSVDIYGKVKPASNTATSW